MSRHAKGFAIPPFAMMLLAAALLAGAATQALAGPRAWERAGASPGALYEDFSVSQADPSASVRSANWASVRLSARGPLADTSPTATSAEADTANTTGDPSRHEHTSASSLQRIAPFLASAPPELTPGELLASDVPHVAPLSTSYTGRVSGDTSQNATPGDALLTVVPIPPQWAATGGLILLVWITRHRR
ncbi:MAG: hypothetical protein AAGK78_06785 [Planctomycetota bacterium]